MQKFHEIIKPGTTYDFIGIRKWAFLLSALVVFASACSLIYHGGLKLGVDFAGGTLIQVRILGSHQPEEVRGALMEADLPKFNLQSFGGSGSGEFLVNMQNDDSLNLDTVQLNLVTALNKAFGEESVKIRRTEVVGPKVGQDMRQKALYAIFYSILLISIYISGRFETKWGTSALMVAVILGAAYLASLLGLGVLYLIIIALIVTVAACFKLRLRFALGAIVALIHDVVATVGLFSVLDKEITLAIVAALLTIVGYSLNDSIIIYDRIRENTRSSRKKSYAEIINASINETLSRTVLTSGTTIMVILCLYLFGGPVNRDFAFALLFGIGVGTFSSIFVSAPILLLWGDKAPLVTASAGEASGATAPAALNKA